MLRQGVLDDVRLASQLILSAGGVVVPSQLTVRYIYLYVYIHIYKYMWECNVSQWGMRVNISWHICARVCQTCGYMISHTRWRRPIRCLIFIGHLSSKTPIIGGSFAKNDLQLKASYVSLLPFIWFSLSSVWEESWCPHRSRYDISVYMCMNIHIYICIYMGVYVYTCVYICTHICKYIHIHV